MMEETSQTAGVSDAKYCRFCSEENQEYSLLDLEVDSKLFQEICEKLTFFKGIDTKLLFNNDLPKTVCKVCYGSLDIAYTFLCKVRNAQDLFAKSHGIKQESCYSEVKSEPIFPSDVKITVYPDSLHQELDNFSSIAAETEIFYKEVSLSNISEIESDSNSSIEEEVSTAYNKFSTVSEPIFPSDVKMTDPDSLHKELSNISSTADETEIFFKEEVSLSNISEIESDSNSSSEEEVSTAYKKFSTVSVPKRLRDYSWLDYLWLCQHCKKNSSDVHLFRKHCQRVHHVCCAFKCADCKECCESFDGRTLVPDLLKLTLGGGKGGGGRFYCEYCNERLTVDNAKTHREAHFCNEQICPHCGDIFETLASLKEHAAKYEPKKERIKIRKPATKQIQDWQIGNLADKSWSGYKWKCGSCSKSYQHVDKLREHTRNVHNRCFDMKCVDCSDKSNCYRNFVHHVRKHRVYLKEYCHYCNHKFTSPDEESGHLATHFVAARVNCYSCGVIFPDRPTLQQHLATYNPPKPTYLGLRPEKPLTPDDLTCIICNKVAANLGSLKSHMRIHTKRSKDHICDICGKAFYGKAELTSHSLAHTDSSETCKICNKSFKTLIRLRKHVTTHSVERPFSCDVCHKTYKKNCDLKRHFCSQTQVMPLKCECCGKGFRRKNNLQCHMRQHTGDRPFSCSDCDKTFANWANCNKHMTRIHNKTLAKSKRTPIGRMPLDPETGLVAVAVESESTREWKEQVLASHKRGRKRGDEGAKTDHDG